MCSTIRNLRFFGGTDVRDNMIHRIGQDFCDNALGFCLSYNVGLNCSACFLNAPIEKTCRIIMELCKKVRFGFELHQFSWIVQLWSCPDLPRKTSLNWAAQLLLFSQELCLSFFMTHFAIFQTILPACGPKLCIPPRISDNMIHRIRLLKIFKALH